MGSRTAAIGESPVRPPGKRRVPWFGQGDVDHDCAFESFFKATIKRKWAERSSRPFKATPRHEVDASYGAPTEA